MLFTPKNFNLFFPPKLLVDNLEISLVPFDEYLGLHVNSDFTDDIDIKSQIN